MKTRTHGLWLVAALVACGGRSVPDAPATSRRGAAAAGDSSAVVASSSAVVRKVALIELQLDGGQVWISITRETGASELIDVGRFDGVCSVPADLSADPPVTRAAVFAADCDAGDAGVRLRWLHREPDLVMLQAPRGSDAFEVARRVALPRDARLRFGTSP